MVRILLFDNVTEQRYQDLVFSTLRTMLRARLLARRPSNYFDATNLSPHERRSWIKLAHDFSYGVRAVFFDVPPEVCIERNHRRERNVPKTSCSGWRRSCGRRSSKKGSPRSPWCG